MEMGVMSVAEGATAPASIAALAGADVSIIVPTLNEAENLTLLLPRIDAAMAGRSYEVIIVDDGSRDGTPEVHAALAQRYPTTLVVRDQPKAGLSGAILEGMKRATGAYLVVMDADLQHPPEKLPELLAPLTTGDADFVVGSRYVPGGSTEDRWGAARKFNSLVATWLARPFSGRTADPMSGFFALKRTTYASAERLTPLGYKIGLELMCKCRVKRVREVPIHFGLRARGQSKLTFKEQLRYLDHLSRLYDYTFPRAVPLAKFAVVLSVSWAVGLGVVLGLASGGAPIVLAMSLGYGMSIAVTALFHLRYVRIQREFIIRRRPWLDFSLISAAELIATALSAWWLERHLRSPGLLEIFVLCFACGAVVRYVLRKELLQDVRGLRKDLRAVELLAPAQT